MQKAQLIKTISALALVLASVQAQAQAGRKKSARGKTPAAVQYRCDGGKRISVNYLFGESTLKARVKLQGKTQTLDWDAHETDKEIEIFNNNNYQLVTDQFDARTYRKAGLRQVTKQTRAQVNGKWLPVSEILYKNCAPR